MIGAISRAVNARATGESITDKLTAMLMFAYAFGGSALSMERDPLREDAGGPVAEAKQAGTVIAVVTIGVVGLVGVLIFAQVSDALPANHSLSGTQANITDGFGNAMDLLPIILIVLLASVVVSVVSRMSG
jgi:hypothetical protein